MDAVASLAQGPRHRLPSQLQRTVRQRRQDEAQLLQDLGGRACRRGIRHVGRDAADEQQQQLAGPDTDRHRAGQLRAPARDHRPACRRAAERGAELSVLLQSRRLERGDKGSGRCSRTEVLLGERSGDSVRLVLEDAGGLQDSGGKS